MSKKLISDCVNCVHFNQQKKVNVINEQTGRRASYCFCNKQVAYTHWFWSCQYFTTGPKKK